MHESGCGTKWTYGDDLVLVRFRSEAGIYGRVASLVSDASDSKGTSPKSEFASAATSLPGVMCYSFIGSTEARRENLLVRHLCHAVVLANRGVGTVERFDIRRIQWCL